MFSLLPKPLPEAAIDRWSWEAVQKSFAKLTGNSCTGVLFNRKPQAINCVKKETPNQVCSSQFCKLRICLCRRPHDDFSVFHVIRIARVLSQSNKEFNRPSRSAYCRYATIYTKTSQVESYLENNSKVSRVFKKASLKKVSLLCRFLRTFIFGYIERAKHDD